MPSRRFSQLSLRSRFLLVLLPLVVAALGVVGWSGYSLLEQALEREMEVRLGTRLARQLRPISDQVESVIRELRLQESWDDARLEQSWESTSRQLMDRTPAVLASYRVRRDAGGTQVQLLARSGLQERRYGPDEGPDWVRRQNSGMLGYVPAAESDLGDLIAVHEFRVIGWSAVRVSREPEIWSGIILNPREMRRQLEAVASYAGSFVLLLEESGRVIYSSRPDFTPFESVYAAAHPCAAHIGASMLDTAGDFARCPHRDPLVVGIERIPEVGLLGGLVVPRAVLLSDLATLRERWAVLMLLTVLLSAAAIHLLTGWVVRPIGRLGAVMDEVRNGRLERRASPVGGRELAHLAESFNEMVSELRASQHALEDQRSHLADALKRSNNVETMKDAFLALVSHEVRTPLTSIMGGVDYLRSIGFSDREGVEGEFFEIIYDSCQRLAGFMNDAILMASLQVYEKQRDYAEFSLTHLVGKELERQSGLIARNELHVENRTAMDKEHFLTGDWTLIQVALEKVLHNACWHNTLGGRIEVSFVDHLLEDDTSLEELAIVQGLERPSPEHVFRALRIFNTGPVIAPERRKALFERFELTYDVENHQKGSGLSMSIVAVVAQLHFGSVVVRAVEGEGMVFYLVFALRVGARVSMENYSTPAGVDDLVATAQLLEKQFALDPEILRLLEAEDLEEALDARSTR